MSVPAEVDVAVVGGGISGLAAAWHLTSAGRTVAVLEADSRLGGKIRTTEVAGVPVDEGADAFLARVPAGRELAEELGLGDQLVSPAAGNAYLWLDGALRPIPAGTVLGVPADLGPVAAAGILTPEGLARAAEEPTVPGEPLTGDVAIGELITRRFGREVADRLVDPLLGGINAGGIDHLSLDVAAAQLASVARRHTSLMEGLRALQAAAPPASDPPAPVFLAPAGGMERLVDRLGERLLAGGAHLAAGCPVEDLERRPVGYRLHTPHGTVDAAGVVVATPAFAAAPLLRPLSPRAAEGLAAVDYASVVLVTLAWPDDGLGRPLDGSGFLVPKVEGRLLTACSWFDSKWPQTARPGQVLLRASAGRRGDTRALGLDDHALIERVTTELAEAMGLSGEPVAVRVSRWHDAFPQFAPGHLDRTAALEDMLAADAPGVVVAGAHLRGVGIPTCITTARAAAARLLVA